MYSALIVLTMTGIVLWGWLLDIPAMRSIIPGLPAMIPATALMVALLSFSLLLLSTTADHPRHLRSKISAFICVVVLAFGTYSFLLHVFEFPSVLVLSLFRDKVLKVTGITYGGRMSVQTSLASICLAASLLTFRLPVRQKSFYVFETLLIAAASLCLIAIVGYLHDPMMSGPTKFIGMSLPSTLGFFLIAVGTVFLKIDEGIVKRLRNRDGAGLFLRLYLPFSILFPLFASVFIHWGEEAGYYPPLISKTMFAVVIIFSLVTLGLFMAEAIRKIELQRLAMEQAQSQAALDESRDSLQTARESLEMALEASNMGTWETDLITGRLIFSGPAKSLVQLPEESVTSELFFKQVHADDLERSRMARNEAIEKGTDINVDFRYVYPDGSIRWFRSQGRAKRDKHGRAVKLNGTIQDITSEKNHQRQLEDALKEAESASSLKSTFLANMSHEIRTPLGAILGFADLLNDPLLSQEDRSRYVQIIRRNGESLSHILNDILDLSKVESGHLDVEKIRFSLKSLVYEVISLLEVRAKDKGLYMKLQFADGMKESIVSDPVRFKQILVNLVGNALKFTSQGGVSISLSEAGSKIKVEISDTGVGIEKDKQKNLFKTFSQADSSITRNFGGTGLGLVLSRKLAELLGGTIELVHSQPGQGSTFVVTLEDFKLQEVRATEKPVRGVGSITKPLKGMRLLLTEDSPDIQKLLTLILKKEGAEVDLAVNGADCLQKYHEHPYDLILMDIQMPIMDGYTAARRLREMGFERPIIALTAHAMSDEYQRCLKAGCDAYLSKPVQRQQLVDLILEVRAEV